MYQRAAKSSASSGSHDSHDSDDDEPIPHSTGGFDAATRGSGGAVPFRADMEHAFGQDFSSVRAHLGQSDALHEMGAHAATQGETIAFASPSPDRELVAHELAHVVQGRQSGTGGGVHAKSIAPDNAPAEVEADAVASRAAAGEQVKLTASLGAGLHLKKWAKHERAKVIKTSNIVVVRGRKDKKKKYKHEKNIEYLVSPLGDLKTKFEVKGKGLTEVSFAKKGAIKNAKHKKHDQSELLEVLHQGAEVVGSTGEDLEYHAAFEDAHDHEDAADGLGSTASMAGGVTEEFGSIVAFANFVQNCRSLHHFDNPDKDHLKQLMLASTAAGNLNHAALGAPGGAARAGRGASSVAEFFTDNDAAESAAAGFQGIGGAVDALKGGVDAFQHGFKTTLSIVKVVRKKGKAEKEDWAELGTETISTLEGIVRSVSGAFTAVSGFLTLAEVGGAFAGAVPAVGAGLNILLQLLGMMRRLIDAIVVTIDLVRLGKTKSKLLLAAADARIAGDTDENRAYWALIDVTQKRYSNKMTQLVSQDIIPMAAGVFSICGSILQVVGVATAAAYGAGTVLMAVGEGLRGGAALVSFASQATPFFKKMFNAQRQFGRDVVAGERGAGWLKEMFSDLRLDGVYNKDKSSGGKLDDYLDTITTFYKMMQKLKPVKHPEKHKTRLTDHAGVHDAIAATGVDMTKLYAEKDQGEQVRLLVKALKKR